MKRSLLTSVLGLVLTAAPASAEVVELGQSRRVGAIEIKLGGYKPEMSGDSSVAYGRAFNNGSMLLAQLEFDYQFFQKYGSAGIGFSAGYAEKYGVTYLADDASVLAEERVHLKVVPLALMLVYRLDYGAIHWGIPLVPYAKLGLALVPWWAGKGTAQVSTTSDGEREAGGKWGYTLTAGLSLLLDVLDPRLARDFDTDVGVNHTYLFAEYNRLSANSFGRPGHDFSSSFFMFGLAVEF